MTEPCIIRDYQKEYETADLIDIFKGRNNYTFRNFCKDCFIFPPKYVDFKNALIVL